ncbi:MAG: MFS transporter [Legionellaceae bacterium]|nr:MFS transporter [Legionellaceae bacterium]
MIGKQKGVVLAGTFGNALEWYDFTIYAFFVPIIAPLFFPNKAPLLSILATFGIFALGFLVRPLGAILFGYIGDHSGRKNALVLSMIMMSLPTFLISLLPTYYHIGFWAPLLLTILRIAQGLAVSGELTTATVFLIEHADSNRRGIAGSLAMSGAFVGIVLSSIIAAIMTKIFNIAQLSDWGWRIPFFVGGLIGIVGLVIRLKSIDPALYEKQHASPQQKSRRASVKNHVMSLNYRTILVGIFLTSIMAIANYFLIAYFNIFLVETQGLPFQQVTMINSIAITIQLIGSLCMGRLSDFIGRKPVLGGGIIGLAVLVYPIFWLLTQHSILLAFLGEILFAIAASAISGLIPTTLAELFDTYHRNMGISMSYNIALGIFGGTAPLVAIGLIAFTQNVFAPAWYVIACASIAFLALLTLKESYLKKLQ